MNVLSYAATGFLLVAFTAGPEALYSIAQASYETSADGFTDQRISGQYSATLPDRMQDPDPKKLSLEEQVSRLRALYEERDFQTVLEEIPPLLQQARESDDRQQELQLQRIRGETLLDIGRFEEAVTVLSEAWERLSEAPKSYVIGNLLATAYQQQGEYDEALHLYMEIMDPIRQSGDRRTEAGVQQNLGVAYAALGDVEEALKRYTSSLEILERLGDDQSVVLILNNIGELYRNEEELEMALDYLERSHRLALEIGFVPGQSMALMNMGLAYQGLGEYEQALDHFDRSLVLAEESGSVSRPIQILYNRGMVYLDLGEYDKAREAFQTSLAKSSEIGVAQGLYYNRIGLGDLSSQLGGYEEAMDHYRAALELGEQSGTLRMEMTPLRGLWETAAEHGQEQPALDYLMRYTELSDSLRSQDRDEALARYQVLLEVQDQRRRNELLEEQVVLQRQVIWSIAGSGVLLLLLIGILFVMYRRQQRLSGLLQSRKEETARLNRKLMAQKERLDLLNTTKDRLISVLAHDLRAPVVQLQGIATLIREGGLDPDDQDAFLEDVDQRLNRSVSMLQDYLDWAQSQMEGLEPDPDEVELQEAVNEVIGRMQGKASEKRIQLQNDVDSSARVTADRQMLLVILQNLISNAIKFSHPDSTVSILLESVSETVPEGGGLQQAVPEATNETGSTRLSRVRLVIRDRGIGIPEHVQKQIFMDPGSRRSGTDNEAGTGLGLIICKEFAEKLGFDLNFRTTSGEGTDFYLEMDAVV